MSLPDDWRERTVNESAPGRAGMRPGTKAAAILLTWIMVATALLAVTQGANAATPLPQTNQFELGPGVSTDDHGYTNILGDGNPSNGPDWANYSGGGDGIFNENGQAVFPGAIAEFIADDLSVGGLVDTTTYPGGGGSNKNNDPISSWHWGTASVPAKDDLSNVYAYATLYEGHLIIYVGFERITANGDSHIDLEFFKDNVRLNQTPPCAVPT